MHQEGCSPCRWSISGLHLLWQLLRRLGGIILSPWEDKGSGEIIIYCDTPTRSDGRNIATIVSGTVVPHSDKNVALPWIDHQNLLARFKNTLKTVPRYGVDIVRRPQTHESQHVAYGSGNDGGNQFAHRNGFLQDSRDLVNSVWGHFWLWFRDQHSRATKCGFAFANSCPVNAANTNGGIYAPYRSPSPLCTKPSSASDKPLPQLPGIYRRCELCSTPMDLIVCQRCQSGLDQEVTEMATRSSIVELSNGLGESSANEDPVCVSEAEGRNQRIRGTREQSPWVHRQTHPAFRQLSPSYIHVLRTPLPSKRSIPASLKPSQGQPRISSSVYSDSEAERRYDLPTPRLLSKTRPSQQHCLYSSKPQTHVASKQLATNANSTSSTTRNTMFSDGSCDETQNRHSSFYDYWRPVLDSSSSEEQVQAF